MRNTIWMIGDREFTTLAKAEAEADYLIEEEGRDKVEIDEVRVDSDETFNGTGYWNLIQTITIKRPQPCYSISPGLRSTDSIRKPSVHLS